MDNKTWTRSSNHSTWNLRYHLVLVTKYRRKAITDDLMETIRVCILKTFEIHNCVIIALNHERDHLHMLFSAPPNINLASLVCTLKTVTSREVRKKHADWLRQFYWKPVFQSRSYYLNTVGDTTAAIVETYIHNQGKTHQQKRGNQLNGPH